jgi:hypothetical protein
MALTPEYRAAIQTAYEEAVQAVNIPDGPVVYNNCPENVSIISKFLLSEGVLQDRWHSSFIWQSAILHCRQNAMLIEQPVKKTREQREAELHAADAAAGSLVGNAHSHYQPRAKATEEETAKAKQWYDELKDPVGANRRRAQEAANVAAKTEQEQQQIMQLFVDPSIPFEQYSPEMLAGFRKLTPANIRTVNARYADFKRKLAQEAAAARRKSQ